MFGMNTKDRELLEDIIIDIFDVLEGKRNTFRYMNAEFSDSNLSKIKQLINARFKDIIIKNQKDMYAVAEAQRVVLRVKNGWYSEFIEAVPTTCETNSLKETINSMINTNRLRLLEIDEVLESYVNNNYLPTVKLGKNDEKGGILERLINGLNALHDSSNKMFASTLQNGLDLQSEAENLKQAVESLSTASNQQAASLEETAAAMEEMTSNVQNNAQKSNDMAVMAAQTDASAKEGAELAERTASAMHEIQEATNSINNAVSIIENIAFQTNILSLNAAVEAATAGDAGKGFAVVAQEVRNLANRSADAAKEIKALAALASQKSNEGTAIANELTKGFEIIADKIAQTTMLVQDVSNASREQMQGISQINTAVTQLDQMTQENAKVAAEADSIADATIQKSQSMVHDASSKTFVGKDQIHASTTPKRPVVGHHAPRPIIKKSAPATVKKTAPITVKPTPQDDDIWESF